jgi:hypothetical protein
MKLTALSCQLSAHHNKPRAEIFQESPDTTPEAIDLSEADSW